jgi:hypothetical protein
MATTRSKLGDNKTKAWQQHGGAVTTTSMAATRREVQKVK